MDVPYVRCSTLRIKPAMAPSDQSLIPHCKYAIALFHFSPHDQSALEERFRGGFVCPSSSPRGIRRLGGRAKGCSFNFFLDAHHGCLYPLCRASNGRRKTEDGERREVDRYPPFSDIRFPLFGCCHIFYSRLDGKTHAGNPPFCPAAIGLLASAALRA